MKTQRHIVVISPLSFLYLILAVALVWVVIQTSGIIFSVFAAGIFAVALNHTVNFVERKLHIRRGFAVGIVMIIMLLLVVVSVALIIPAVASQINSLIRDWPHFQRDVQGSLRNQPAILNAYDYLVKNIGSNWGDYSSKIVPYLSGILGSLLNVFTFFILLIYLLISGKKFLVELANLMPSPNARQRFLRVSQQVSDKLGYWLRGQVILCFIIGIMAFAFLGVLGIPFALTLAIIAGIFEAVPMVGAYLGAIPAVLVALTISPVRALIVAIGFTVIQQLEGNIIVPQVMRRAIGVHPMVILIAALMGGTLFGFAGVLIAIPVTAAASVIWASMRDDLVEKATAAVHEQKGHK